MSKFFRIAPNPNFKPSQDRIIMRLDIQECNKIIETIVKKERRESSYIAGGWFTEYNKQAEFSKLFPEDFKTYKASKRADIFIENGTEDDINEGVEWETNEQITKDSSFALAYYGEIKVKLKPFIGSIEDHVHTFALDPCKIYFSYKEQSIFANSIFFDPEPTFADPPELPLPDSFENKRVVKLVWKYLFKGFQHDGFKREPDEQRKFFLIKRRSLVKKFKIKRYPHKLLFDSEYNK